MNVSTVDMAAVVEEASAESIEHALQESFNNNLQLKKVKRKGNHDASVKKKNRGMFGYKKQSNTSGLSQRTIQLQPVRKTQTLATKWGVSMTSLTGSRFNKHAHQNGQSVSKLM